jgi:hypothetical protein
VVGSGGRSTKPKSRGYRKKKSYFRGERRRVRDRGEERRCEIINYLVVSTKRGSPREKVTDVSAPRTEPSFSSKNEINLFKISFLRRRWDGEARRRKREGSILCSQFKSFFGLLCVVERIRN